MDASGAFQRYKQLSPSPVNFGLYSWMRGVSLLSATPLSDKTSSRVHGVLSCPVMSCPTQTAVLWAGAELAQGWMTFLTPILVCSLGGARAPVAQAGATRTNVIWEVWEVFDHNTPVWEYLPGRYCAANGGVNYRPHARAYVRVYARMHLRVKKILDNRHQAPRGCRLCAVSSCHDTSVKPERLCCNVSEQLPLTRSRENLSFSWNYDIYIHFGFILSNLKKELHFFNLSN